MSLFIDLIKDVKTVVVFFLGGVFFSCANVDQIDRGLLAKRIMQLDPHPEETVFQEEVHAFREGAVGGGSAVGGGCGCN